VNAARFEDPAAFLEAAGPVLLADETRHALMLGIAGTAALSPDIYPTFHGWLVTERGAPIAAALRTPPSNLVLAAPRSDAALAQLVEAIDDDPHGAGGALPEIDAFGTAWSAHRGVTARRTISMRLFRLEQVLPVPVAPGRMRRQELEDTELLVRWLHAFEAEARGSETTDEEQARRIVELRLHAEEAGFMVWEDGGAPVTVSGYGGRTPNGMRIGPVYTPPELRGRGYATALVAELSSRLLADGRRFCCLFTDLANPTSNRIYQRIGYAPVCDWAELSLG